jgi:Zn-dependent M28 family amino/carboxypeptidase
VNRFPILFVSLITAAVATAQPAAIDSRAREAATAITRDSLESTIRFLASDDLEGRAPASRGDQLTRLYLQTQLQALGLQPGGANGQWQQPFPIVGINAEVPKTWVFRKGGQTVDLAWWDEFIAASGVQRESAQVRDSELVFVGYGIEAPEYQWDDFKDMDLKGKVLVMLNNDPDWDPKLFEGNRRLYYGRWRYKYESAASQGAAGAIIIHTTPSAGYGWNVVQTSWTGEQFELPAAGEPRIEIAAWTTEPAARELMALAGQDLDKLVAAARQRDFKPVPLGVTTSLQLKNKISRVETANVLGLLPGSDSVLRNEVVIYTAHHDHIGVGEPDKTGDRIYNGAVDNATGTAQVLTIARAFKALGTAPRRSILFLFVAAEEQGLLGSQYYAQNPTFVPGRIAANINYDGGNIWGPTADVVQIGYGKSSVDEVVRRVAQSQNRVLKAEQFPDRGSFYRSDQFNFAKIGVPAIYLDEGVEFRGRSPEWGRERINQWIAEDYHQPSDEIEDDWNFDGMIEDGQLGFYAGYLIAQKDELPAWNPGDEFEAPRQRALAALNGGPETTAPVEHRTQVKE